MLSVSVLTQLAAVTVTVHTRCGIEVETVFKGYLTLKLVDIIELFESIKKRLHCQREPPRHVS